MSSSYNLYFFHRLVNQIDTSIIDKKYIKSLTIIFEDDESNSLPINPDDLIMDLCSMTVKQRDKDELIPHCISTYKAYIDVKLLTIDVTDSYNEFLIELDDYKE